MSDHFSSVNEFVIGRLDDRTSPEPDGKQNNQSNIWTGKKRLQQDASKTSTEVTRDEVESVLDPLIEERRVFTWHGLLAPVSEEHLTAIIENERASDAPRKLLIKRANRWLRSLRTDSEKGGDSA